MMFSRDGSSGTFLGDVGLKLRNRRRDRGRDGRAEQTSIQERLDVSGREDVVRGVEVVLGAHAQLAHAGAGAVERAQDVEQTDEHRSLSQDRETAHDRVESVLLLELLHLDGLALTVARILLLQCLDLWLQFLHLTRRADLLHERLVQNRTQGEHQEHHGKRPGYSVVRAENEPEDLVPDPQNRGYRIVDEIEHGSKYSSVRPSDCDTLRVLPDSYGGYPHHGHDGQGQGPTLQNARGHTSPTAPQSRKGL